MPGAERIENEFSGRTVGVICDITGEWCGEGDCSECEKLDQNKKEKQC